MGDEREEPPLQLGIGHAKGRPIEQRAQSAHARLVAVAVQCLPQARWIDQVESVRIVHRPLQRCRCDLASQINQRENRRCEWNAIANLAIPRPESQTAMKPDARPPALMGTDP